MVLAARSAAAPGAQRADLVALAAAAAADDAGRAAAGTRSTFLCGAQPAPAAAASG